MSKKYMDIIPPKTAISGKSVGDAIDANAEVAKVAKDSRVTVENFAKNSPAEISENADLDSAEIKNTVPEDTQTAAEFAEISQENDENAIKPVEPIAVETEKDKDLSAFDKAVDEIQDSVPLPDYVDEVIDDAQKTIGVFAKIREKLIPLAKKIKSHKLATFATLAIVVAAMFGSMIFFATQTETGKKAVPAAEQFLKDHGIAITKSDVVKKQAEFEKNVIDKGGRGAVYSVPFGTYDEFRNAVLGRPYDIDGAYGAQCWDGVALLYEQVGRNFTTGGTGAAKGTFIPANGGGDFQLIPADQAQRGDIIVFSVGTYGHVGFLDGNWGPQIRVLGQNQNGDGNGSPFSVVSMSSRTAIGAIRFNPWHVAPEPAKPDVATPDANPTTADSYVVKKGDTLGEIILKTGWRDDTKVLFGNSGQAQELANFNDIANRGLIYPGQVIKKVN